MITEDNKVWKVHKTEAGENEHMYKTRFNMKGKKKRAGCNISVC